MPRTLARPLEGGSRSTQERRSLTLQGDAIIIPQQIGEGTMQRRLAKLFAAGSAFGVVALLFWSHPAGADVVTPPGACVGTGVWQGSGLNESTTKHVPGDVIIIPQSDTVAWTGLQRGFSPGQQGP